MNANIMQEDAHIDLFQFHTATKRWETMTGIDGLQAVAPRYVMSIVASRDGSLYLFGGWNMYNVMVYAGSAPGPFREHYNDVFKIDPSNKIVTSLDFFGCGSVSTLDPCIAPGPRYGAAVFILDNPGEDRNRSESLLVHGGSSLNGM